MKKFKVVPIVLSPLLLCSSFILLCSGAGFVALISPCIPNFYPEINKVDVGNNRSISIYSNGSCLLEGLQEPQKSIYYSVSEANTVVTPRTFAGYYEWPQQFAFKVAYADNQSLVMIYDPAQGYYQDLAIIVNFKTRDSWPADWRVLNAGYDVVKNKSLMFFSQLQQENPDLYRPRNLVP